MSRKQNKHVDDLTKLCSTLFSQILKIRGVKLLHEMMFTCFIFRREKNGTSAQEEGW
jgi:hypothetical protein